MNNKISIISLTALVALIGSSDVNAMGFAQQAASKAAPQAAAQSQTSPKPSGLTNIIQTTVKLAQDPNMVFVTWCPTPDRCDSGKGKLYGVGTPLKNIKVDFGTRYGDLTGDVGIFHITQHVAPEELTIQVNGQIESNRDYQIKSKDVLKIWH